MLIKKEIMNDLIIPQYFSQDDTTNIRKVIDEHYDIGKTVSFQIWDNYHDVQGFEDLYHTTLYNAIKCLDGKKMLKNEIAYYFFRAFRVNVIRLHQYAYQRLCNDIDIDGMLIPLSNEKITENHLDGWGMIELVRKVFDNTIADALMYELNGFTVKTIKEKFNVTYYQLSKVKDYLKSYYNKEKDEYRKIGSIWLKS